MQGRSPIEEVFIAQHHAKLLANTDVHGVAVVMFAICLGNHRKALSKIQALRDLFMITSESELTLT
jgi:hypothetical protein